MRITAIDPGASGAIAHLDLVTNTLKVFDTPTFIVKRNGKNKTEIDAVNFGAILRNFPSDHVIIEQVSAMPGQGVTSMFNFGKSYGIAIGCVSALEQPVSYVHPLTWKKAMLLSGDKDGSRRKATELLPGCAGLWMRVKDDGRAEAALLAIWYLRSIGVHSIGKIMPLTMIDTKG